jgi:hypothetical protein
MKSKTMMNQEFVKQDRFDGMNFVCWKDKMMFLFTTLKISYILDLNLPEISASTPINNNQLKTDHKKQDEDEDEWLCRGHILNNFSNYLYDLFISIKSFTWNLKVTGIQIQHQKNKVIYIFKIN